MQKKIWIVMALLVVVPALLFSVSCQKKVAAVAQPAPKPAEAPKPAPAPAPAPAKLMVPAFMAEDIYFDYDKSVLKLEAQANLKKKAEWMKANAGVSATIEGHCDERGTNEYNLALGERRAESAKKFLVDLGVDPKRLTTISYGEERPVDPRHTEEAWAKNRRAHFVVN